MPASFDVFLNYDPADDRPAAGGDVGWVSHIRRALEIRLSALLVRKPTIRTAADAPSSTDAAAMVCLATPAALTATDFGAHVNAFSTAPSTGVPPAERLFAVLIQPVQRELLPPHLRNLRSYECFAPGPLGAALDAHDEKRFWMVIDDLAHAIEDAIDRTAHTAIPQHGTRIYLAETSTDLQEERERIRRELQRHGHIVVPNAPLPESAADAERVVREELARCSLSINLIGAQYGTVPRGGDASVVALQHRLALAQCHTAPDFHHVIWIPPNLVATDPRQQAFLGTLRQFTEVGRGTELVQTVLEDFKTLVEDKLRPAATVRTAASAQTTSETRKPKVYMMFDRQDRDVILPLQEFAKHLGVHLVTSVFEGEQSTLREIHQENLRTCDAALIIYGNVREPWVRMKQQDLLKAAGFGRSTQMLAKAIYICPEETEPKRRFDAQEVMVIKDFGGVSPESLQPFLEKVLAQRGGTPS